MMDAAFGRLLGRGRRRGFAGSVAGAALLSISMFLPATAPASGRGQTVRTVIHLPALVLINECNGDAVNLSGDLYITTTSTPTSNGGYTVRSSSDAHNLRGAAINPPMTPYRGQDGENSFAYYAPPPYPSTFTVTHWTKLVPQANAPSMYLVIVLREVVAADGTTVPTFQRAYLTCTQPKCSAQPGDH
jgi:hypothetical protein